MLYIRCKEGGHSATDIVHRSSVRETTWQHKALGIQSIISYWMKTQIVQVEKLPEAKQAGEGIIQQPVFGGTVCVTC